MEKPFINVARRAGMAYQNISRIVLRMEGVCRARPHDDEPSVVRSRLTVYHELYPAGFYTRDWGFFVKTIWLVVDFGEEGRSECVKLLTVVNLNQNSRRQDAPKDGVVGFCTGPNRVGPIRRATTPTAMWSIKLQSLIQNQCINQQDWLSEKGKDMTLQHPVDSEYYDNLE